MGIKCLLHLYNPLILALLSISLLVMKFAEALSKRKRKIADNAVYIRD